MAGGRIDCMVVQNPFDMGIQAVRLLLAMHTDDDATIMEMFPKQGEPGGDIYTTGLRLIIPDQRGFGESVSRNTAAAEPASIEQLADDVVGLLDALHVDEPAVIVGVSMGGYVAQQVAARHPDRVHSLVLCNTKFAADTPEARAGRADLAARVGRVGQRILAEAMIPNLLASAAATNGQSDRAATEQLLHEIITSQPVATIQAALGNRFRITGISQREASDLALLLRAGALAAPMYIVEERTVGASLGEDNIRAGMLSVAVGFALVLLFMLVYYRLFGLAANVALAVNLVLLTAVMSLLGATLTLPGIAGIVLTVGMAVDA
ncbi:MAG: alpha/beta fold hydrolase, partial [Planctomycetia bacterium]|nr:alpha/beta fold hydrolase [Planctomycetia bacterium]